jgi:hypothetical protein
MSVASDVTSGDLEAAHLWNVHRTSTSGRPGHVPVLRRGGRSRPCRPCGADVDVWSAFWTGAADFDGTVDELSGLVAVGIRPAV